MSLHQQYTSSISPKHSNITGWIVKKTDVTVATSGKHKCEQTAIFKLSSSIPA